MRASFAAMRVAAIVAGVFANLTNPSLAAEPAPITPTTTTRPATPPDDVATVLSQLDDDNFIVRQSASLRINNLPGSATPAVEAALKRDAVSPEARLRMESALAILRPRAVMDAKHDARDKFIAATLHAAYRNGGHTAPAWDAAADDAIDAYLKLGRDPMRGPSVPRQAAIAAVQRAAQAGCEDPLIRALAYIAGGDDVPLDRAGPNAALASHRAVQAGPYPPLVKFIEQIGHLWSSRNTQDVDYGIPSTLIADAVNTPGLPPGVLEIYTRQFVRIVSRDRDAVPPFQNFLKVYAAAGPQLTDPILLSVAAQLNTLEFAYDRTGSMDQAALAAIKQLLLKVYEMDPGEPRTGIAMITLLGHQSNDDAKIDQEMQLWFSRATAVDPDGPDAYSKMMVYLSPEGHGSVDRMVAFGRQCLATKNWRGGVPMALIEAHRLGALFASDQADYLRQPEVWKDINEVYRGAVVNAPNDATRRSEFAKWASRCNQWEAANEQFKVLADSPDLSVFVSKASYEYLRAKAARLAAAGKQRDPESRP